MYTLDQLWFGCIFHISQQVGTFHHILSFELSDFKFVMPLMQESEVTRKKAKPNQKTQQTQNV